MEDWVERLHQTRMCQCWCLCFCTVQNPSLTLTRKQEMKKTTKKFGRKKDDNAAMQQKRQHDEGQFEALQFLKNRRSTLSLGCSYYLMIQWGGRNGINEMAPMMHGIFKMNNCGIFVFSTSPNVFAISVSLCKNCDQYT